MTERRNAYRILWEKPSGKRKPWGLDVPIKMDLRENIFEDVKQWNQLRIMSNNTLSYLKVQRVRYHGKMVIHYETERMQFVLRYILEKKRIKWLNSQWPGVNVR
jgi:fibrillarin-like rRNA methylase